MLIEFQKMVEDGFTSAGLSKDIKLQSLGLSLSGCESVEHNQDLEKKFKSLYPGKVNAVAYCRLSY